MQPKSHHKRRHRKKLHLGEFQQLGFPISATFPSGWSDDQREQAMAGLLAFVEQHGLDYGGGDSPSGLDGYLIRSGGSATDVDRDALRAELQRLGMTDVEIGALEDAWYAGDDA